MGTNLATEKDRFKVEETINKWFVETNRLMQSNVNVDNFGPIDGLCVCVLQSANDYCNASLLLLNKKHERPAKALLRVLCELSVKLIWCLRDACVKSLFRRRCRALKISQTPGNATKIASSRPYQHVLPLLPSPKMQN